MLLWLYKTHFFNADSSLGSKTRVPGKGRTVGAARYLSDWFLSVFLCFWAARSTRVSSRSVFVCLAAFVCSQLMLKNGFSWFFYAVKISVLRVKMSNIPPDSIVYNWIVERKKLVLLVTLTKKVTQKYCNTVLGCWKCCLQLELFRTLYISPTSSWIELNIISVKI